MNETQMRVIDKIKEQKMIVILRAIPEELIVPVVGAIIDGGISLVEVTFDHTSQETLEITPRCIKSLCDHFGDKAEIGAGTVTTCADVSAAMNAGASFMISPNTDEAVIKYTKKMGLVSIPGAYTPSEICNAHNWGADFVKLFPIVSDPVAYIKAVRAPLKHIPMLAVGGVNENNLGEVMKTGVSGIGVGSGAVTLKELSGLTPDSDFSFITKRIETYVKNLSAN